MALSFIVRRMIKLCFYRLLVQYDLLYFPWILLGGHDILSNSSKYLGSKKADAETTVFRTPVHPQQQFSSQVLQYFEGQRDASLATLILVC